MIFETFQQKETSTKPVIHNVHILDASGSMSGSKYATAKQSIRDEYEKLKENTDVIFTETIIAFQSPGTFWNCKTKITEVCFMQSLENVEFYFPLAEGNTPLLEAIGYTLNKLSSFVKETDRIIITIFTDGVENASQGEYSLKEQGNLKIKELISELEKKNFTVTFMGTERDVETVKNLLKIHSNNTIVHENTSESIHNVYTQRQRSLTNYSKNVAFSSLSSTDSFFKQ